MRRHTRHELTPHLAARLGGEVARRDETRVARRLDRQPVVEGGYRRDAGALRDAFVPFLADVGGMAWLADVDGTAIPREMVPGVPDVLRDGLKTLCGMERIKALPPVRCSDAALRRLIGVKVPQVRHGVCQRGPAKRQGEQAPGPIGPDTLATQMGKRNVRALEAVFKGAIRGLAQAGGFDAQVTGMVDGTDLATTERSPGCGQVTRKVRSEEKRGQRPAIAGTVDGGKVLLGIAAATKLPLAVKVGKSQAQETHWTRALVMQAQANLAGAARRRRVVWDQGLWAGTALGGVDQQGSTVAVPAHAKMAVTADARAPAAAGEEITVGRRAHPIRHGQGRAAWTARRETAVVGLAGLTTAEPYGTPEPGGHHHRRDCQPPPMNAVVGRQWHGRDAGPGGNTVCLTNAAVHQPLQPFDADADRRLIETCWIKEAKPPWELGHPPQKHDRAVRVPVVCTVLMCALATAYRLRCEQAATGGAPVGWPRWRRQLLAHTRDQVLVLAQGAYGLVPRVEYSRLLGAKLNDVPPGVGTRQEVLAQDGLTVHGEPLCWNLRLLESIVLTARIGHAEVILDRGPSWAVRARGTVAPALCWL